MHRQQSERSASHASGSLGAPAYGDFAKLGVPFEGPNNKAYNILGLHWGSPILGKYRISSDKGHLSSG